MLTRLGLLNERSSISYLRFSAHTVGAIRAAEHGRRRPHADSVDCRPVISIQGLPRRRPREFRNEMCELLN